MMKLIKGEFEEKLNLLFAPSIKAGFPSPADDYMSDSLDFNRDLIKHPEATFYGRVEGDSMIDLGICEGDIAVIDRSIEAEHGDVVVSYINGEFKIHNGPDPLCRLALRKSGEIEVGEKKQWRRNRSHK